MQFRNPLEKRPRHLLPLLLPLPRTLPLLLTTTRPARTPLFHHLHPHLHLCLCARTGRPTRTTGRPTRTFLRGV
jgi:hypothetical protein